MAAVAITGISYDPANDTIILECDFSALSLPEDVIAPQEIHLRPAAIGNRIALNGLKDGDAALTEIVMEHAVRVAPDAKDTTVEWQSPSDEERATQLDAHADSIEAARVFYASQELPQ